MTTVHEPARDTPVIAIADVVVAGGGPSGIAAAVSAARNGASVVLVERYGFLGGNAAMFLPVMSFFSVKGEQVIKGIAQEIIDRLIPLGGSIGHIPCPVHMARTPIDPDLFKIVAIRMLEEAGVRVHLHTFMVGSLCERGETGDTGELKAVLTESKSGRTAVGGRIFIDATGDGDLAVSAGAPYLSGREADGHLQPPTLTFRVGGVDTKKLRARLIAEPERYKTLFDPDHYRKSERLVSVPGLEDLLREAKEKDGLNIGHSKTILSTIIRENEMMVNMARVPGIDGSKAEDLSRGEMEARKQITDILRYLIKYVPGFEEAYLLDTSHQLGIRETRRIVGEYILTAEDVLNGHRFDDVIAIGGYPIDLLHDSAAETGKFTYTRDSYDIPYRCLVPKKVGNLIVVGRCISATHEAMAATRVMATCMAEGEAAGAAAALCVRDGVQPLNVNMSELQERLRAQGAFLG